MATRTRQTAESRREAVLEAARDEFARHGLHGASTDAIARRAGISQPYLFRLFGSKKQLFLAVNDMCFAETLDVFRAAASGKAGAEALQAIGEAYGRLITENPVILQGQLQAYALSVEDEDIRKSSARGYGRLVDYVETVSGADRQTVSRFFASGMLMNTLMALGVHDVDDPGEQWLARLLEGCKDHEPTL
jgi:AcrR family transcriptional regulator